MCGKFGASEFVHPGIVDELITRFGINWNLLRHSHLIDATDQDATDSLLNVNLDILNRLAHFQLGSSSLKENVFIFITPDRHKVC